MIIINNKKSSFHICYSKDADECTRYSATELQKYIYKSTKVCIPVFSDKCERRSEEIHVGLARDDAFKDLFLNLSDEAFKLFKSNRDYIIVGKTPRGTMYGVYYFLNKYLGFRCLSNDTELLKYTDNL